MQSNRITLVSCALASWLAFGCGGTGDQPDPTKDPTYLPEHPDATFQFDDNFSSDPNDLSTLEDAPSGEASGDYGTTREAFKSCWTGPGFAVKQGSLGTDNVPDIFGPCYQGGVESAQDCMYPQFTQNEVIGWQPDNTLNNAFCTVGTAAHPEAPGISWLGMNELDTAATQWKTQSGVNYTRSFAPNPGEPSVSVSVMCAPAAYQDAHPTVLGSASPWGPTRLNGAPPQLSLVGQAGQDALDANYPIQNPNGRIMYDGASFWVDDRNLNNFINTCGGTLAQRQRKMHTLVYLLSLHEFGHVFGFWHTQTGIMKPGGACSDLGDGNSTGPRPAIPQIYGDVFRFYSSQLIFQAVPAGFHPDPTSPCHQIPIPLAGSHSDGENVQQNTLN